MKKFNPTLLTISIPSNTSVKNQNQTNSSKPRWSTIEFGIYYIVCILAIKKMFSTAIELSQEQHPNYSSYQHKLSPGWILNRKIDISDLQYKRFRFGLVKLCLLSALYLLFNQFIKFKFKNKMNYLKISKIIFSILILLILHGTSIFKILIIIMLNYLICQKSFHSSLIWIFNILFLFSNDYWDGYRYRDLHPFLSVLNKYRGLIPRWQIGFNISMLRLISYGFDYQWALRAEGMKKDEQEVDDEKNRTTRHRKLEEYGFMNYFIYIFYPPLYIAGPIISFNNFMSQMEKKPSSITPKIILGYAVRFVVCFLTMEYVLHYMYVIAIKDARAWHGDTPLQLCMIGYWNLIAVWLKLLIPWRFFRLWALLDGVDAPENMVRCMANNFSTQAFWRSWHRSYNLWIVRYIYLPLGGSKNLLPSTVLVFTFVALWHDLSLRLLWWGWLVSLFVAPEVIVTKLFKDSTIEKKWYFRHLCAAGGTVNVLTMMSANLVGFAIGLEGVKVMWIEMLSSWSGFITLVSCIVVLFCAVQLMMEYREEERRRGIWRKC
ncbi:hypothetical protein CROQUDRAFT_43404 [Cronartium quercuum f. sp. fusiforme G11]|uniref:Glycerol uptake protein 1 n=1 Tax=Cronartium quercuum f. sp. fusiforme G11 TaxID=708437 RepID=A0A9P6NJD7_9BASI|nr:hypothetical protein CROQUDRAFT_43404 [Cronartium quercuum f. sp. fusiforme G11]